MPRFAQERLAGSIVVAVTDLHRAFTIADPDGIKPAGKRNENGFFLPGMFFAHVVAAVLTVAAQAALVLAAISAIFAYITAVFLDIGVILGKFLTFTGRTGSIAFAFILPEFTAVTIALTDVLPPLAFILSDIPSIPGNIFLVRPDVLCVLLDIALGGVSRWQHGYSQHSAQSGKQEFNFEHCNLSYLIIKEPLVKSLSLTGELPCYRQGSNTAVSITRSTTAPLTQSW